MSADPITVTTSVNAPLTQVWDSYLNPDDIIRWNAASDDWHTTSATVDLRVGGTFTSRMEAKDGSMGFDFSGTYTDIVPHKRLGYTFGDRTATVDFAQDGDAVKVQVTFDPEDENSADMQRSGWQSILDNFARFVEAQSAGQGPAS